MDGRAGSGPLAVAASARCAPSGRAPCAWGGVRSCLKGLCVQHRGPQVCLLFCPPHPRL